MKTAISNIGWTVENDEKVYHLMRKYGFCGLEIAPTRIFSEMPYERWKEAKEWKETLKTEYGFSTPSMQSIWYGRQEKIFGSQEERRILVDYTKKAIDFASAIECGNLVFGCPRNRNFPENGDWKVAIAFFKELGDYAAYRGTAIGMEANPAIYNTNFINDTEAALELIRQVDSKGFLLNLDVGTMIYNKENAADLKGYVKYINHVHISEPGLMPIEEREIHEELYQILKQENYAGYVSIEMGKVDNLAVIERQLQYVGEVFINGEE